jgi:hypothetical protein
MIAVLSTIGLAVVIIGFMAALFMIFDDFGI